MVQLILIGMVVFFSNLLAHFVVEWIKLKRTQPEGESKSIFSLPEKSDVYSRSDEQLWEDQQPKSPKGLP